MAVKLILLVVAVQAVIYVQQYGWVRAVEDAGWLWGLLVAFWTNLDRQNVKERQQWDAGRKQAGVNHRSMPKGRWT